LKTEHWINWYLGYDEPFTRECKMDELWNDVLTGIVIQQLFNPGEGYEETEEGEPVDLMHAFHLEDD
jgi:hypothetical protein